MENIFIPGTPKTPEVSFIVEARTLSLSGRSIPENSIEFYLKIDPESTFTQKSSIN